MTYFIIGVISGIAALLLCIYIICKIEDRRIKKEIGEDYNCVIRPKSEDIKLNRNVTICLKDNDIYTAEHLDDDKNIIAFINFNPKNIERADFYYSLFANKQVITIDYNLQIYEAIITEIKLTDYNTLRIYYNVLYCGK